MPVDGLMGDDPSVSTSNIVPIRNYVLNLDDLENVESFNNPAQKDQVYGFWINDRWLYEKAEISSTSTLDNGGIVNKPLIPLPLKYDWGVEINLKKPQTGIGSGLDQSILKVFISRKIIGSLV